MNQTNNTIQFSQFAAVSKDSDEVLFFCPNFA